MQESSFYTEDEIIRRAWDNEEIKKVMSRRSYYNASDMRREELNELWVSDKKYQDSASFGRNWGYYVGMEAISDYYVVKHNQRRHEQLNACCEADPGLENAEWNLGYGAMAMHPVNTPIIEVAADGRTARGVWYSAGHETTGRTDGTADAFWTAGLTGVDFVREGDKWKIWHLVIITDFFNPVGKAFEDQEVYVPLEKDPIAVEFGTPTIPMLTHNQATLWLDDYPARPKPYHSFRETESYGPKGHPDYKEVW